MDHQFASISTSTTAVPDRVALQIDADTLAISPTPQLTRIAQVTAIGANWTTE
jgi:hypothetical protein